MTILRNRLFAPLVIPALALLGLASTACKRPEPAPVIVKVPVPVPCPPPEIPARPHLLSPDLPAAAPPDQVAKALIADLAAVMGYSAQLERILDGYRSAKATANPAVKPPMKGARP